MHVGQGFEGVAAVEQELQARGRLAVTLEVFARAGYEVVSVTRGAEKSAAVCEAVKTSLNKGVVRGRLAEADRDAALGRITWSAVLDHLADVDLVVEAIVEFTGRSGHARAARKLGEPVEGHENRRLFRVRRLEPFSRWLLSLAGEAEPVGPEEVVGAWRRVAGEVAAIYGRPQGARG